MENKINKIKEIKGYYETNLLKENDSEDNNSTIGQIIDDLKNAQNSDESDMKSFIELFGLKKNGANIELVEGGLYNEFNKNKNLYSVASFLVGIILNYDPDSKIFEENDVKDFVLNVKKNSKFLLHPKCFEKFLKQIENNFCQILGIDANTQKRNLKFVATLKKGDTKTVEQQEREILEKLKEFHNELLENIKQKKDYRTYEHFIEILHIFVDCYINSDLVKSELCKCIEQFEEKKKIIKEQNTVFNNLIRNFDVNDYFNYNTVQLGQLNLNIKQENNNINTIEENEIDLDLFLSSSDSGEEEKIEETEEEEKNKKSESKTFSILSSSEEEEEKSEKSKSKTSSSSGSSTNEEEEKKEIEEIKEDLKNQN